MRRHIVLGLTLTLGATAAIAAGPCGLHSATLSPAAHALLHPSAGHVPFTIRTTQPRRVVVHDVTVAGTAEYVCTTPCRLYVEPGPLAVSLEGWCSHVYRWDVPSSGGSVSLLSRSPSGALDALPEDRPAVSMDRLRASN